MDVESEAREHIELVAEWIADGRRDAAAEGKPYTGPATDFAYLLQWYDEATDQLRADLAALARPLEDFADGAPDSCTAAINFTVAAHEYQVARRALELYALGQ
jgi:predicted nucleotidyltransferase